MIIVQIEKTYRFGVLGSGSWATALAKLLANNLNQVSWFLRNTEHIAYLKAHTHPPKYLQSVTFDLDRLHLYDDLDDFLEATDIILVAVPSAYLHSTLSRTQTKAFHGKFVLSAVKGIIPEFHAIPARYFHKTYGIPYENLGIICGPCHAEEIALERLSYLTIGSENEALRMLISSVLKCHYVEVHGNDDLFGAELSAILKNVYALASGMYAGLGYGDNFQAVLVSNALQEMKRFIDRVHPIHRDVASSAYLGDLLVTCYSKFSRNRTFGFMLGQGYSIQSAKLELGMVAEGYYAASSLMEINKKFEVSMPILTAVYDVIYQGAEVRKRMQHLTHQLS